MQSKAAPQLERFWGTALCYLPQRDEHPVKHPSEEELGATGESQPLMSVQPPHRVKMSESGSAFLRRRPVMPSYVQPQEAGALRTGHKDTYSMKNRPQKKTLSHSKVPRFTSHLLVVVSRYNIPCPAPTLGLPSGNGPQPRKGSGDPRSPSEGTHLVLRQLEQPHILSTVDISGRRNMY